MTAARFDTAGTREELLARYGSRLAAAPERDAVRLRSLREEFLARRDEIAGLAGDGDRAGRPSERGSWICWWLDPGRSERELREAIPDCAGSPEERRELEGLLPARTELNRARRDPRTDPRLLRELGRQLVVGPGVEVLHDRPAEMQAAVLRLRSRYPILADAAGEALRRIAAAAPTEPKFDRPVRPPAQHRQITRPVRARSSLGWGWAVVILVFGGFSAIFNSHGSRSGSGHLPRNEAPKYEPPKYEPPDWRSFELPKPDYRFNLPPRDPRTDEETRKIIEELRRSRLLEDLEEWRKRRGEGRSTPPLEKPDPAVEEPDRAPAEAGDPNRR